MPSIQNEVEAPPRIFQRYPKTSLGLIGLTFFLLFLALAEIALGLLAPVPLSNVGFVNTPNGLRFGWGFEPHGLVRIENPDTGKVSSDRVNANGWRDRERTYDNPGNAFRVVIFGDSQTFGYIVPKEKTFTWVLEDRFKMEGLNVEIINISYSGWSTSQQLEALETEGMKYHPDLVITHFVPNDIDENLSHIGSGKFSNRIPFFHEVNPEGELVRRENANFAKERDAITRKYILSKSEVLKTLWLLHLARKHAAEPTHKLTAGKVNQLKLILGGGMPEKLENGLSEIIDQGMDAQSFEKYVDSLGVDNKTREVVLRVAENHAFQRDFNGSGLFEEGGQVKFDKKWPLYFEIMKKIKAVASKGGARVAISSDQELGRFNFEKYWFRAPEGEVAKKYFFQINDRLKTFAIENGIGYVEHTRPAERAKYDPHLNENGNQAIAMNIYDFLMREYGEEINNR